MSNESDYSRLETNKSRCMTCNSSLTLLYRRIRQLKFAQFYICWTCRKIWEVGEGEVKEE